MPSYLSAQDLGEPVAISFRANADTSHLADDIRLLEDCWGRPGSRGHVDREDWLLVWRNIRALATRLLRTLDQQGRCDPETWHHLLMAVGNFKRQAGDIHPRVTLSSDSAGPLSKSFLLPGDDQLECDAVESWQVLTKIPGLGQLPTTSCLLAALWPDHHAIMDVRDRRAAVGLQVGRRSGQNPSLDSATIPSSEWWFYDWFRRTVTATARAAGTQPVEVERALYVLHRRTEKELPGSWKQDGTWSTYYSIAIRQAGR